MGKIHFNKAALSLLKVPVGKTVFTSLRYRDDKNRRALHLLKKEGYYLQEGRFLFKRTDKLI